MRHSIAQATRPVSRFFPVEFQDLRSSPARPVDSGQVNLIPCGQYSKVLLVETATRFHSKIDLWLVAVFAIAIVLQSFALFQVLHGDGPVSAKYVVSVSSVLVVSLIASILLRTHYTIAGDQLRIVCGPLVRHVSIAGITRVTETRNPLSSPALSLDRLRIEYGNDCSVMVSPDDKRAFLAAIRQQVSRSK